MGDIRSEPGGAARDSESGVRRSYLVFPAWSQPLWTLLTGKPLRGESPPWRPRPAASLGLTLVSMMLLAVGQYLLLTAEPLAANLVGALLAVPCALVMAGLLRSVQVVFGHHAIHGTLLPAAGEDTNRAVAAVLTILALSQNESEYERDHLDHHRRAVFTTLRDADANLLYSVGLKPGIAEDVLRRRLLVTLLSPRFHGWFLAVRLRSNMRRPLPWRVLALSWMALVFIGAPLALGLLPAALVLWLPLVPVYQMSALLQFSTEHVWLQSPNGPPCMNTYAARCLGRFCGEAVPGQDGQRAGLLAWSRWWLRTLFLHVPTRLCVLVGDLPAHDWHHLCGILRHDAAAWPSAIYERQRAIDNGRAAGMQTREVWGLDEMVTHVLRSLAQAAPFVAQQPQPTPLPAEPAPRRLPVQRHLAPPYPTRP